MAQKRDNATPSNPVTGRRMIVQATNYCACGAVITFSGGGAFDPHPGGLIHAIEHFIAEGWLEIEDDAWACPKCQPD